MRAGAVVRVSSYDAHRRHHPLFAIDGEPRPSDVEKWASHPRDPRPFLEIGLARPADVARVVLVFGAGGHGDTLAMHRYRIVCLRGATPRATLVVDDNRAPRVMHPVDCPDVDRVRIEFVREAPPLDVARVFEVEAWER